MKVFEFASIGPNRPRILLDNNVWRYLTDFDQVESIRKAARAQGTTLIASPAVMQEVLRSNDAQLRRSLMRTLARGAWSRGVPEVAYECGELYWAIRDRRPAWLRREPDFASWSRLHADWVGSRGIWWRARVDTDAEAGRLGLVSGDHLQKAQQSAYASRETMSDIPLEKLDLASMRARPLLPIPGWQGDDVEPWRLESLAVFWRGLFVMSDSPWRDWLEPLVDLAAVQADEAAWNRLWLYEADAAAMLHNWLRWAFGIAQATRRTNDGTPVDNQIGAYLAEAEVFATCDKAFVAVAEKVGASAPSAIACPVLLAGGHACGPALEQLIADLSPSEWQVNRPGSGGGSGVWFSSPG